MSTKTDKITTQIQRRLMMLKNWKTESSKTCGDGATPIHKSSVTFLAFACAMTMTLLATNVQADTVLVNVDFNNGFSGITQSGAAAVGTAGDVWNATPTFGGFTGIEGSGNFGNTAPYGAFELNDTTGALSGISHSVDFVNDGVGFTGIFANGSVAATGGQNLLGDYVYVGGADAGDSFLFELSGLATNTDYSLYLYGNGDQSGQGATWTLNGSSQTSGLDGTATYDQGGEFAKFSFNTGASTTQAFAAAAAPDGAFAVNGYQLTVSAIPEPSSLALSAFAGLSGMITRRRRKSVG